MNGKRLTDAQAAKLLSTRDYDMVEFEPSLPEDTQERKAITDWLETQADVARGFIPRVERTQHGGRVETVTHNGIENITLMAEAI